MVEYAERHAHINRFLLISHGWQYQAVLCAPLLLAADVCLNTVTLPSGGPGHNSSHSVIVRILAFIVLQSTISQISALPVMYLI